MASVNKSNFFKILNNLETASKEEEIGIFNFFINNLPENSYLSNMFKNLKEWVYTEINADFGRDINGYINEYYKSIEAFAEADNKIKKMTNQIYDLEKEKVRFIEDYQCIVDKLDQERKFKEDNEVTLKNTRLNVEQLKDQIESHKRIFAEIKKTLNETEVERNIAIEKVKFLKGEIEALQKLILELKLSNKFSNINE